MDHISIFEIILAVLGTVIAVFQFIGERRISREERKEQLNRENEKKTIEQILKSTKEADELVSDLNGFKAKIDMLSHTTKNDPQETVELFDKAIDEYEENFKSIESKLRRLYEELLMNEERFPMAYGYGRYIQELRGILNFDELLRSRRIAGYDKHRVNFYYILKDCVENKGGKVDMQVSAQLAHEMEEMVHAMEPYFKHAESISSLLEELKIKYENRE